MKINYITDFPLSEVSGGWSGINFKMHEQLSRYFEINYIGAINPKSYIVKRVISKLKRTIGLKGEFHFFSEQRLNIISKEIQTKLNSTADMNFFFGQTPWVNCQFNQKYALYMDACFPTYMEIYKDKLTFNDRDLARISKSEEQWLSKAETIFIGSDWAWNEMQKHYDMLREKQKKTIWTGGNIAIPDEDIFDNTKNLLFISLNFEKKGGFIAVDAFKLLKAKYPNLTLTIIGQKPPAGILAIEGINYAGFLNKNKAEHLDIFIKVLSKSFMLIHPTVMDTMGAVIIEAGYYGCPAIAPRSFGIPELIKENETGYLVNTPFKSEDFADTISKLFDNQSLYLKMRKSVREHTINTLSWNAIGKVMSQRIINS